MKFTLYLKKKYSQRSLNNNKSLLQKEILNITDDITFKQSNKHDILLNLSQYANLFLTVYLSTDLSNYEI